VLEGLPGLVGLQDVSALMAAGASVKSTERNISRAALSRPDLDHWVFLFEAKGFLRHMVRNLVGTLVDVGRGKLSPEGFVQIIYSRDRRRAGMTAPAHGLFLVDVKYESNDEQDTHGGVEDETR
ncbi:MAG: hypothetical protein HGB17_07930, partial [Syntrophobacteraceae bacterium]|nr:hypothetical protein [Syntrophobacteraceae bacterium]